MNVINDINIYDNKIKIENINIYTNLDRIWSGYNPNDINSYTPFQSDYSKPQTISSSKDIDRNAQIRKTIEEIRKQRERVISEEQEKQKAIIDAYMKDIFTQSSHKNFRGWMLTNGTLLSQYYEKPSNSNENTIRQDHNSLVDIFFNGLEKYDPNAYKILMDLYEEYRQKYHVSGDVKESFAVEVLGWMQIGTVGLNLISYRGENWQDRLLAPFFTEYGFHYQISDNGVCEDSKFFRLYDHISDIIELGLEKKYQKKLTQK